MSTVDPATQQLLSACTNTEGRLLWLADEHHNADVFDRLKAGVRCGIDVVTNRVNVYQSATHAGLTARFCDWTFEESEQYDTIALRVCKEKAVNQHLLKACPALLKSNGELILSGEKTDGIKSYCKDLQTKFSNAGKPKKHGLVYLAHFQTPTNTPALSEDETYHQIRPIVETNGITLYSKPGQYGWTKIDQGSQKLVEHFRHYCAALPKEKLTTLLDLGCGYGYLTFAIAELPFDSRTATDNNAAAVLSCRYTAQANNLSVHVSADDLGKQIQGQFDFILCNPPFHTGFDVQTDLTRRFLQAARSKLTERGQAFFVVNSFVGLEKRAQGLFSQITLLENDGQFKVFCLRP